MGGHDLARFVEAQDPVWRDVLAELGAGRKRTHWMWFVFPQVAGLGSSAASARYGLASVDEARAYLAHPVLGPRLEACTRLMLATEGGTAREILGTPDDMKFRSSMTIFGLADPGNPLFREALDRFCGGAPDPRTLQIAGAAT
jgi:uncharacterized protein (DUF1810 family)